MVSRGVKAAYYTFTGPFMRLSGALYRWIFAPSEGNMKKVKVHLGPGQANYLESWTNVDANLFTAKIDVWADLRNPLPFKCNTVDIFYSHHVIEHLPNLQSHFNELFRCLKPGGKIRIGGPNGDSAIDRFMANDTSWFGDFPDKRNSIGGKFENFIFCRREHLTILTFSFLEEMLKNAGFIHIHKCLPVRETNYTEYIDNQVLSKEYESDFNFPHTLIIEAEKIDSGIKM